MARRRKRLLYDRQSSKPFRISRSKIELFLNCPRCFYLDRRSGIKRPSFPAFTLNSAVDALLKNEFDLLRESGEKHELMKQYNIDAIHYNHPDLPTWRDDFYKYIGASCHHSQTNLEICGIIDDIWQNPEKELIIVDYKSTSTKKEISLEDEYKQSYKRQMEVYQWIFRQNGFTVSETGYFVFANAGRNRPKFDGKLEFELLIIAHQGDTSWVEPTLIAIKECLNSDKIPSGSENCEYCQYRKSVFGAVVDMGKEVTSNG
ncbi:PD-(D/E)XK nuclease family protein [Patescibacteria group bacterium]|nr:PD-(D/E)XK nuclease family protein [Patescibacteria group bacterium]